MKIIHDTMFLLTFANDKKIIRDVDNFYNMWTEKQK